MRKTHKRSHRRPTVGWEAAHWRLEDRFLLSGSSAASATVRSGITDPAWFNPTPAGVFFDSSSVESIPPPAPPGSPPVIVEPPSAQWASSATASGGSAAVVSSPDEASAGLALGPFAAVALPSASVSLAGEGRTYGPGPSSSIGGTQAAGAQGPALLPTTDPYLSYHPVDPAAMGILPSYAAQPCASMASIVGEVEIEVADLDEPASPPQPATEPELGDALHARARADETASASAAGAVSAPAAAPEAVPTADPGATPAEPVPAPTSSEGEADPVDPPAPIGLGLRLTAPLLDAAGWDEAVGQLVEGVDGLLSGLADLGGEANYVPWVVAAGAALGASEVARRVRSRPGLAAAFVDGSVSVVEPEGDHRGWPRGAMLSDSVRRLLARGLSRWTTRR